MSATRILLVEDDDKLAQLVSEFLSMNSYEVLVEPRGDTAVARILDEVPSLVILDLMLPGLDGLSICRQVRPRYQGPILMLTAKGDEVDEIIGLEMGADDYLGKPVRPRLLLTRIKTLLRRVEARSSEQSGSRLVLGRLILDPHRREAHLDDEFLELTTAEYDLLWFLAQHPGQSVTRDEIYEELRGIEWDGLDRSIDLRVARLRKKLGDDARHPQMIKSIRGVGYLLAVD